MKELLRRREEERRVERARLRGRDYEELRDEHGARAWAGAEK